MFADPRPPGVPCCRPLPPLPQEDVGGFSFENGREVMAWINHALQRPADGALACQWATEPVCKLT